VAKYQREYSLLVAEETYTQANRGRVQQIRSDLLLVRQEGVEGWVAFRDVFEVDRRPVRDREDRLKRLFLDPSAEARARLEAIKTESARYNVGTIGRNVNVPLYALKFLDAGNVSRFRFSLSGKKEVGAVAASRISYEEISRPTLLSFNNVNDLPARGWFLVDPASGAILGSRMEFEFSGSGSKGEFEVRYARDPGLGLWVPSEMTEIYWNTNPGTAPVSLDARATYSNYRRFQVKTEERIKLPI
jgi:hypothetical protein